MRKGLMALVGLGTLAVSSTAFAFSSDLRVTATRNPGPPPTTTFTVELCVCMSAAEIVAYNNAGGGTITVTIPAVTPPTTPPTSGIIVVENDFWDDDELGGTDVPPGTYSMTPNFLQPCPPGAPSCGPLVPAVTLGPVPDSSYESENPADFQLGQGGSEGTVPPGTTTTVPGCGTGTPTMNNHSS